MRELTDHKINGCNEALKIQVLDEPGSGNACHEYDIHSEDCIASCVVKFQNGPIGEAGVNGVTNESLLAVVIDRLRGFQSGSFACRENALALTKLEEALHWLQSRTRDRLARGVEGTHKK